MKLSVHSILSILICLTSVPAFADLTVIGGTADQRSAIVSEYWNRIPGPFHTTEKIPVQLLGDIEMNRYLDEDSGGSPSSKEDDDTVDGVYEDGPALITLRSTCPEGELEYTVTHEYGHYVWNAQLREGQRQAYNRIYNLQKSRGRLISDYASCSVDEGFAEAFATYSNYPSALKAKDRLSFDFIYFLQSQQSRRAFPQSSGPNSEYLFIRK